MRKSNPLVELVNSQVAPAPVSIEDALEDGWESELSSQEPSLEDINYEPPSWFNKVKSSTSTAEIPKDIFK